MDSASESEYFDAPEEWDPNLEPEMDLETSLEQTKIALDLFLNNHFSEARRRVEPWAKKTIYHAVGYSTITFIQAVMTFEPEDIELAVQVLKSSVETCNRYRKKHNALKLKWKASDYDKYSEEEAHAELCFAECLLLRALVTFIESENIINIVKGGLKIRQCYQSYRTCKLLLENKVWSDSRSRMHFESGVKLGIGTFNLMLSMLPSKILKILEFVGFSGNREYGLAELEIGRNLILSLRAPLCSCILVAYHSVITFSVGTGEGNLVYANEVLEPCLKKYSRGAMFSYLSGKIAQVSGNIDESILILEQAVSIQIEWIHLHHMCYWELMWCYAFKLEWSQAAKYANKLRTESKWSQCSYTYLYIAFLSMVEDPSDETKETIRQLCKTIPSLRVRIAGKSIPFEKFAEHKAKRYISQGSLLLPGLEMIYVWNGFAIFKNNKSLVGNIVTIVEKTLSDLEETKVSNPNYFDDYCLVMLLKAMCLWCMDRPSQAEMCFHEILSCEKNIVHDKYLLPFTTAENGFLFYEHKRLTEAKKCFVQARKNYKGHMMEARLHFKMHSVLAIIKSKERHSVSSLPDEEAVSVATEPPNGTEDNPAAAKDNEDEDLDGSCDGSGDLFEQGFQLALEEVPND